MWSVELGGGEVLAFDADDVAHDLEPGSEVTYVRGSAQRELGRIVSVTVSLEEWPPVYTVEIIGGARWIRLGSVSYQGPLKQRTSVTPARRPCVDQVRACVQQWASGR